MNPRLFLFWMLLLPACLAGVARADGDGPWQFLGVLPLFDPPREQAIATIATARQMGIDVKMVTGDQVAIARETYDRLKGGVAGVQLSAPLGRIEGVFAILER